MNNPNNKLSILVKEIQGILGVLNRQKKAEVFSEKSPEFTNYKMNNKNNYTHSCSINPGDFL